jgi:hypothetical protein
MAQLQLRHLVDQLGHPGIGAAHRGQALEDRPPLSGLLLVAAAQLRRPVQLGAVGLLLPALPGVGGVALRLRELVLGQPELCSGLLAVHLLLAARLPEHDGAADPPDASRQQRNSDVRQCVHSRTVYPRSDSLWPIAPAE